MPSRRRVAGWRAGSAVLRFALGPSLGQCCGGVVFLRFTVVGAGERAALAQRLAPRRTPVALFGAGHVGHALVRVLSALPFALTWIDSRDSVFPAFPWPRPRRRQAWRASTPIRCTPPCRRSRRARACSS